MRILVTGGTGTVGSQVARELRQRAADVHVLTRDKSRAGQLPQGVTAVEGNLQELGTVRSVFNGFEKVFLLNHATPTEASEALMAVTAMRTASVKHIVYLSVHHTEKAAWLPHFGTKVAVEEALKVSGIPYTILRPNNFFQNDYWYKDALLEHGVYPQPIGETGLSRVDVRDIAEAAAIALTTPGHEGHTYDLAGPEEMTGTRTAAIWSRVLERPVKYAGNDLDEWEKQSLQYLPDWQAFEYRHMYEYFQMNGLKASAGALSRLRTLLGHPPRAFEAFAAETAASWK